MDNFHHLGQGIVIWVGADGRQAQARGRRLRSRVQLVIIKVEAGQCPDHVGFPPVVGKLGRGMRDLVFSGDLQVRGYRPGAAIGAGDGATGQGIFAGLRKRQVLGLALEIGQLQTLEQFQAGLDVRAQGLQLCGERLQAGRIRQVGEAANRHGDGMRVPPADQGAQVAGSFFHPERPSQNFRRALGQRDDAAYPQQVRRDEQVDMQNVAI